MLDDAERTGREAPTTAERLSVVGHGLGARLDRRLALIAVIMALVTVAAAGVITVWGPSAFAASRGAWILPALTVFLGPSFVMIAGTALARERGLVTEPRAVIAVLVSLLALAAATLTQVSWALGFNAADRGVPATNLAAAWSWLFSGAWAVGAAAIATFVDALLRSTRLHSVVVVILSVIAGALLAPALGISLSSPYTAAVAAAAVALATILSSRSPGRTREFSTSPANLGAKAVPVRTRVVARLLAAISSLVCGVGVVYALTGSQWGGARDQTDQTEVMGQGITIALIGALPLLAAIGVLVAARGRTRPLHTWGPLMLIVFALAAVAVAYRGAPAWGSMVLGFAAGSLIGGVAIAWWTAPRLPGSARVRGAIAVLVGVVYAAFLGILIAPMLAFFLPFLAAAFAIWTPGRPPRGPASKEAVAKSLSGDPLPRLI